MVEAEFFFQLLMRLLADPSGFDRGGELLETGIGRKVGHIVFSLAGRPPFADEPDFVARHALRAIIKHAVLMTVRNADAAGRERDCQEFRVRAGPVATCVGIGRRVLGRHEAIGSCGEVRRW